MRNVRVVWFMPCTGLAEGSPRYAAAGTDGRCVLTREAVLTSGTRSTPTLKPTDKRGRGPGRL
jgi:hypothetical protein